MKPDKLKILFIALGATALGLAAWAGSSLTTRSTSANTSVLQNSMPVEQAPATVVLPAGTRFSVRLDHAISTATSRPGEQFSATLNSPVLVDGKTVVPAGARVEGYVISSAPSGRLKGRAVLSLGLSKVWLSDNESVRISTKSHTQTSSAHKKRNFAWIGGGSGGGALIGALAGGGQGAAIGAASGAAAGLAGAVVTGRKQVKLPAETALTFQLYKSVDVPYRG